MASCNLSEAHWNDLYQGQDSVRKIIAPAYVKAIAPLVASAIKVNGKSKMRILVVGGGRGVFSTRLLPPVKELLSSAGLNPEISVVESDVSRVVRSAPKPRVMASVHNLPFKAGSFDLVVGESMLHQSNNINAAVSEISRVLAPDGFFIHIQDAVPDPRSYVAPSVMAEAGLPPGESRINVSKLNPQIFRQIAVSAHAGVVAQAHGAARANGMRFAAGEIKHEVVVGRRLPDRVVGMSLSGINSFRFDTLGIHCAKDSKLPRNSSKLGYAGIFTMASKSHSLEGVMEALGGFSDRV